MKIEIRMIQIAGNSGSFAAKEDNFRKINKISEKYLKLTENIVQ